MDRYSGVHLHLELTDIILRAYVLANMKVGIKELSRFGIKENLRISIVI